MKLAIMQPYLFPYIGYFQLINSVDKFIIYDDVNFIRQGWINRNRILISGSPFYITVPIKNASSFVSINNTLIANDNNQNWKKKWKKTLQQAYTKASQFNEIYPLIEHVFDQKHESISSLAINSIWQVCHYLNIPTLISNTSTIYQNNHLNGEERVIDICQKESCKEYINAIGGKNLYSKERFSNQNIKLSFLQTNEIKYKQFAYPFAPFLSIIDVLMHNNTDQVKKFLDEYQLL